MINHIFKLIWNSKKGNSLIIAEIFISFIVLFVVITIGVQYFNLYQQPLGFSSTNVWHLNLSFNGNDSTKKQSLESLDRVKNRLKALPQTAEVSFTKHAAPYQPLFTSDWREASHNQQTIRVREWSVDEHFNKVLKLALAEGRWLKKEDDALRVKPIVINQAFKKELFGDGTALGNTVKIEEKEYTVVGMVENFRQAENAIVEPGFFSKVNLTDTLTELPQSVLIKLKTEAGLGFEEQLLKEANTATGNASKYQLSVASIDNQRTQYLQTDYIAGLVTLVICGFLIGNVIVGLFGVLWQNVNKRSAEIGVRRALGATEKLIYQQMIGEILVLTTLSIIPGSILAIQFVFFNPFGFEVQSYLLGIFLATLIIYLLVILCALYPSRRAAKVHPSVALHSE